MTVAGYHAAGAGSLGDDDVAVGGDLRDREADVRKTRNVLVAGIGEISARHLRAAFEQVPAQRPVREAIQSSPRQRNTCSNGPSDSAESATRPARTISAPWSSACAIGCAPR